MVLRLAMKAMLGKLTKPTPKVQSQTELPPIAFFSRADPPAPAPLPAAPAEDEEEETDEEWESTGFVWM